MMKKTFAAVLLLLLIASVLGLSACGAPGNPVEVPTETPTEAPTEIQTETPTEVPTEAPEPTPFALPEPAESASAETHALAAGIITKMREEHHNFTPGTATYADHYATFQWSMPEMAELEKADDGALALIEYYEETIVACSELDLTEFQRLLHNKPEGYMQTELYSEGMAVFTDVMDIEGLLSMPVFLEKLTDEQKERLYSDINLLWGMRVDAGSRVEGLNTSWKSYFDTSKREQDIDWDPIFDPQPHND